MPQNHPEGLQPGPVELHVRQEGSYLLCYVVPAHRQLGPMEEPILIGSIAVRPVHEDPELKNAWIQVMARVLGAGLRETMGAELVSVHRIDSDDSNSGPVGHA